MTEAVHLGVEAHVAATRDGLVALFGPAEVGLVGDDTPAGAAAVFAVPAVHRYEAALIHGRASSR